MARSKSFGAFAAFKTQNLKFMGNESKLQLFLTYSDLTFWRRIFFLQILAHPVFKM